jgi:hypothetical protein
MSGSINFQRGPLRGWTLHYHSRWEDGECVSMHGEIEAPFTSGQRGPWGGMVFTPDADGWQTARKAEWPGGVDALLALAEWMTETFAQIVRKDTGVDNRVLDRWRAVADLADTARSDYRARYPDGRESPFQVAATLVVTVPL